MAGRSSGVRKKIRPMTTEIVPGLMSALRIFWLRLVSCESWVMP